MKKRIWMGILCAMVMSVCGFAAQAAQNITAVLTANPVSYDGTCPAKILFNGQITVTEPCALTYQFIRSDGAVGTVKTLNFQSAGKKTVEHSWTLGGQTLQSYKGWEAIQVLAPLKVRSNQAEFSMHCAGTQAAIGKPDLGLYAGMWIGKHKKEIKWNAINVLTPDDAQSIDGGKWVFNVVYQYKEFQGVAVNSSFKNKITFNGKVVSDKTIPSLAAGAAEQIEDQVALTGPNDGKLQLKIDADNQIVEFREDNNTTPFATIQFKEFKEGQASDASAVQKSLKPGETKSFNPQPEPPGKQKKKKKLPK